jgi:hypothetical protein
LKDVVKINLPTSNRSHLAFVAISYKTGDISKFLQSGGKEVNFLLLGSHKDGGIIGIKGGSNGGGSTTKPLYVSLLGRFSEGVV